MTTKSVDTAHLRSVVLAGHAGAGKTTLAEALLYRTGAISRQGRVEDGTTTLDFEPEEQKRHMSLSLAVASLDDEGNLVTIVDTPGYPDFAAEVVSAYQAVDSSLICVDATGGVEAGTELAVALARRNRTATLFVVNKCDRENADPAAVLDALRDAFGTKIAPLQLAMGKAEAFSGYVDLVHRKAYRWDGKQEVEIAIPAELEAEVATAPRPAPRGGRRGRRRRPDEVPRGRGDHATRSSMPACIAASATRSSRRSSSPARPRGSACGDSSTRSSATCRRRPRNRRPSPAIRRAAIRSRSRPMPPDPSWCASSRRPPTRSSAG